MTLASKAKPLIARDEMPLCPILVAYAFSKWGIDFVGPIKPPTKSTHAKYIIVATNYLTNWAKARAITRNDSHTTTKLLYEQIFTRSCLPLKIVLDRGVHFVNEIIEFMMSEFLISQNKSTPYHPPANGQAQSTNKTLCTTLTKVVSEFETNWE